MKGTGRKKNEAAWRRQVPHLDDDPPLSDSLALPNQNSKIH
jgi:hypothetical protein